MPEVSFMLEIIADVGYAILARDPETKQVYAIDHADVIDAGGRLTVGWWFERVEQLDGELENELAEIAGGYDNAGDR
jgi:hypothetical protein